TSSKPHIGNAYDPVLADMIARYKKMQGFDVYFQTGTDEHGQKIEEKANEAGITHKEYVDKIAGVVKEVWVSLNVGYDRFIRTTDADHEHAVSEIFKKLYAKGDIYKGHYEGKYCTPCESFFTESQLVDGRCPDCGREVIDAKEEAYSLKLSKYQDKLLKYFEDNPDFIKPESRKNEMINNFLKPGLSDLCVSRSTFKWGIPVEFDSDHVIYVWIDALSNYITGLGFLPEDKENSGELYKKFWPCDLHVIGKDIVRFHTIYWPIILMALGEELPKQVLAHPWLLSGEDKMSKSRGNVIYADELAKRFSADAVRYYLLSEMPFGQDGTITYDSFISRYNTDLANNVGNLVNRTVAMTNKYFGGKVTKPDFFTPLDSDVIAAADECAKKYVELMDEYRNSDTTAKIMLFAKRLNKYIDETTPWVLAKSDSDKPRLNDVLYVLLEGIRYLAVMLTPFVPETASKIFEQLGSNNNTLDSISAFGLSDGFSVGEATPLFARLDAEKIIAELTAEPEEEIEEAELITIDDFAKVELTAAEIKACEPIEKSKKLLKLTLFDGKGERTVASGIREYYSPDDLIGKTVVLVSNLKPAKLCGVESKGMILAADDGENVKVLFLDGVKAGSKIR
ncbi:MAG: methionine--tRNA ligase, partial [Oscillospiraceae bacterium]|nr:methionine--tRNA ligase [Candidatus Equicaccousia limihippi]